MPLVFLVCVCALVRIHEYMLDPFYGGEWVDRVKKIPIQILHYGCSGRRLFIFSVHFVSTMVEFTTLTIQRETNVADG